MIYPVTYWQRIEAHIPVELLTYLGRSPVARSQFSPTLSWVVTDVDSNDYNGVMQTNLPDNNANQVIRETLSLFRQSNLPFLWYVHPGGRPTNLAQRLQNQGCVRLSPGVFMAMDLTKWNGLAPVPPGITISPVTSAADLAAYLDVWTQVMDDRREPREQLYLSLGLAPHLPLRHYVAWQAGCPVAGSQLFLGSEAAGLQAVAVLPEAQRRGIGTAITQVALQTAQTTGYQFAIVGPTPESQEMYRRIGFQLFPSIMEAYHIWPGDE